MQREKTEQNHSEKIVTILHPSPHGGRGIFPLPDLNKQDISKELSIGHF
jgi:hypothetical protein